MTHDGPAARQAGRALDLLVCLQRTCAVPDARSSAQIKFRGPWLNHGLYAIDATPARIDHPLTGRFAHRTKIRSAAELETNLEKLGKDLGKRVLDALFHRDRLTKRELTEVGILQFISTTAWKALWGKAVDSA